MVATAEGLVLAETHRQAQAQIAAKALGTATLSYRTLLDPADLDGTFPAYAKVQSAVVQSARKTASQAAGGYYSALRSIEGADGTFVPVLAEAAPDAQLETALLVTGPVTAKRKIAQGETVDDAMALALRTTLGAVSRIVADGHRQTILRSVGADSSSRGWARRDPGSPCHFCAMLISRGPVYRSEATASFRSHDHCHCEAVPIFSGTGWTEQAAAYRAVWDESTKGLSNDEARSAFRRALSGAAPAELPAAA